MIIPSEATGNLALPCLQSEIPRLRSDIELTAGS